MSLVGRIRALKYVYDHNREPERLARRGLKLKINYCNRGITELPCMGRELKLKMGEI